MKMEQTFLMIKPDGVQRGLIGEIVCRFEKKGLQLCAAKFMKLDEELASATMQSMRASLFIRRSSISFFQVRSLRWSGRGIRRLA